VTIFKPFSTPSLPKIGWVMGYNRPDAGIDEPFAATFEVTEVNRDTGCIYLRALETLEKAREALSFDDKDKHGEPIKSLVFAWIEKRGEFAVNVEWDAWGNMFLLGEDEPNEALKRAFQRHKELIAP